MSTELHAAHRPPFDDDPIDLIAYARVLFRHRWLILGTTFCAALASAVVGLLLPKSFIATAKVLPRQQDQSLTAALLGQFGGGLSMVAGGLLGSGTMADTYAGMLQTDSVRDALIDKFGLMKVYGEKLRTDTYNELNKRSDISVNKKDGIIAVSVEDKDPVRAAAMANSYIAELEKLSIALTSSGATENRVFLEARLAAAKADMARAEDSLKDFQQKNKIIDVSEQVKTSISGIAELQATLAAQEVGLQTLRRSFTDSSQEVRNAMGSIATVRSQIAKLEGQKRLGSIPSIGSTPALVQEQVRLLRGYKVQEALTELLTKQYEIARLTEAQQTSPIQVLQKARAPDKKSRPSVSLIVAGTTSSALLLACAAAFVVEHVGGRREPESRLAPPAAGHGA